MRPPPPERPLLAAAIALALGAGLTGAGPPGVMILLALGVVLVGIARRRGHGVLVPLLLTLLAAGRASLAEVPTSRDDARDARGAGAPPAQVGEHGPPGGGPTTVGRWMPEDRRRGVVLEDDRAPPAPWLLAPEGPPPGAGSWVTLLPGGERLAWPRGPVPGPRAREGRFLGLEALEVDQIVRWAPAAGRGGVFGELAANLRPGMEALRARLAARLDRHEESAGLERGLRGMGRALLLGDRSALDPAVTDLFTRTGTRHLLAVSGLHVGLVAGLVLTPLVLLARGGGLSARGATVARALLLLAYVPVAGGSPPVLRASLALAAGWIAPAGRRADSLSIWSLALVAELLRDPRAIWAPGVSLSYLATLGLLLGTGPLAQALRWRDPEAPRGWRLRTKPGGGVAWLRALLLRGEALLRTGIAASLAAGLATLPVIGSTFGELAPAGILATPLLLPLFAVVLVGWWGAVLLPGPLSGGAARGASWALELLVDALRWVDTLPGTPWLLPQRPGVLLGVVAGLALLSLRWRTGSLPGRLAALGGALLLLPWSPAPAGLEVHALDVGHGTCVVLRGPGLGGLVFDAGSRDRPYVAREALAPLLAHWEVARPVGVLSHDHRDHRNALEWLLERTPPRIWMGALPARMRERLPHDCVRIDTEPGGIALDLEDGPRLLLARGVAGRGNEGSRWLRVVWRGRSVLLGGDAEAEGLDAALGAGLLEGPVEVLLLPHHGSDTPWLGALLDSARPRRAWVSSGGLPAVAAELDRRDLPWTWTGEEGGTALFLPP